MNIIEPLIVSFQIVNDLKNSKFTKNELIEIIAFIQVDLSCDNVNKKIIYDNIELEKSLKKKRKKN